MNKCYKIQEDKNKYLTRDYTWAKERKLKKNKTLIAYYYFIDEHDVCRKLEMRRGEPKSNKYHVIISNPETVEIYSTYEKTEQEVYEFLSHFKIV